VKIAEIVAISGADGLLYSRRSVRLRLSRLGATGAGFQSPKIKISHFGLKFHNTPRLVQAVRLRWRLLLDPYWV